MQGSETSEKNYKSVNTKALLSCALIACPLFILAFIFEGSTRTAYDSFRHPISSLSIGDLGWMQKSSFIITGSLLLAFAFGLRRVLGPSLSKRGPILIGLVGIGLIGAGVFSTDPVYGYPTDQPLRLAQFTLHGHLHDLFSMFVFICLPYACLVFRRWFISWGEKRWARYSLVTAIIVILTFFLAGAGFKQTKVIVEFAGIFQRMCIITGMLWIAMLALYFLKTCTRTNE